MQASHDPVALAPSRGKEAQEVGAKTDEDEAAVARPVSLVGLCREVLRVRGDMDEEGEMNAATLQQRQKLEASLCRRLKMEAMRAKFRELGLWSKWTMDGASLLVKALESLPEDLWARGVLCPVDRVVMLGATSKRVRALLARLKRRVPAAAPVARDASMQSVVEGLPGLIEWCQVVRLTVERGGDAGGAAIREDGARILAGALTVLQLQSWRGPSPCSSFRLTVLQLQGNRIGAEGARILGWVLRQCSSLAELNLRDNAIGAEGAGSLVQVLGQCSALAVLNLAENGIGDEGARALAGLLRQCSSLVELQLESNDFGDEGAGSLAEALGQCSALAVLNLGYNGIGAEGARRLAGVLGHCSHLAELRLQGNDLGHEGTGSLAEALGQCSALAVLNLADNKISAEGAQSLGGVLGRCSHLAELKLNGNDIGAEGARILGGVLARCSSLTVLRLARNHIGAEGAESLAVLGECHSLAELTLYGNGIGSEGARRLSGLLPFVTPPALMWSVGLGQCSALTKLDLAKNDIGDEGARALAGLLTQCSSLVKLKLEDNCIGHDGKKSLAGILEEAARTLITGLDICETIEGIIQTQDGSKLHFKMRPAQKLKPLMEAYCERKRVTLDQTIFLFRGRRLREGQTPRELGMKCLTTSTPFSDKYDSVIGALNVPNLMARFQTSTPTTSAVKMYPYICVQAHWSGRRVNFKINESTGLGKLMKAFCEIECVPLDQTIFVFRGRRLHEAQTARELGMEDDAAIEALDAAAFRQRRRVYGRRAL